MVVMSPISGGISALGAARTPVSALPANAAAIARAKIETGSFLVAQPVNGLGDGTPSIPDWAIWLAGGVAVGAVAGYALWRKRRKG